VEQAAAGKPVPSDLTLGWRCHFLNAEAGVVFVPFTLEIQRGSFTSFPVAMYIRVVTRRALAPAPGPRDALAQYPFEDAAILEQPHGRRIARGFTAPPGHYDVYVALTEKATAQAPVPKTVVVKQEVDVPDLQSGLSVSSLIAAEKVDVDPGPARPDFEEQLDNPYALWGMRVTPAMTDTFRRESSLSIVFLVYNATADAADKPDVEIRYLFHRKTATAETLFTTAPPERFDARTLAPRFSIAAGDLIIAAKEIPLTDFADGEYRLEIDVTDRINAATATRDLRFRVVQP
jgi:hypothetical protein